MTDERDVEKSARRLYASVRDPENLGSDGVYRCFGGGMADFILERLILERADELARADGFRLTFGVEDDIGVGYDLRPIDHPEKPPGRYG